MSGYQLWVDLSGTSKAARSKSADSTYNYQQSALDALVHTYDMILKFKKECACACPGGRPTSNHGALDPAMLTELLAKEFPEEDPVSGSVRRAESIEGKEPDREPR